MLQLIGNEEDLKVKIEEGLFSLDNGLHAFAALRNCGTSALLRHLVSFDNFINLSLIAFNFELKPENRSFNTVLVFSDNFGRNCEKKCLEHPMLAQ